MQSQTHEGLEQLKKLFDNLEYGADEAVGLLLTTDRYQSPYEVTPAGVLVFASTGGDGVHFSFLLDETAEPEDWPVVMTVPMQFDRPNLVLGANLREFLALGLRVGYFVLEQLAYDLDEMIGVLDRPQIANERPELMASTLDAIATAYSIAPWEDHRRRLDWLQRAFPQPVEN